MAEESTAWGVVIGAAVPILIQFLADKKEAKQWKRQQEAEEKKAQSEVEKALKEQEKVDRETIREIYRKCIRHLTYFDRKPYSESKIQNAQALEADAQRELSDDEIKRLEEAEDLLLLFQQHCVEVGLLDGDLQGNATSLGHFHSLIREFLDDPKSAGYLKSQMEELSLRDWILHSPPAQTSTSVQDGKKTMKVYVAASFRREEFIAQGIEIPQEHSFSYTLNELTPEQRRKLLGALGADRVSIHQLHQLPTVDPSGKSTRGLWEAKLNPSSASVAEIFAAWEKYYDEVTSAQE